MECPHQAAVFAVQCEERRRDIQRVRFCRVQPVGCCILHFLLCFVSLCQCEQAHGMLPALSPCHSCSTHTLRMSSTASRTLSPAHSVIWARCISPELPTRLSAVFSRSILPAFLPISHPPFIGRRRLKGRTPPPSIWSKRMLIVTVCHRLLQLPVFAPFLYKPLSAADSRTSPFWSCALTGFAGIPSTQLPSFRRKQATKRLF